MIAATLGLPAYMTQQAAAVNYRHAPAFARHLLWLLALLMLAEPALGMPPQVEIRAIGHSDANPGLSGMAPLLVNVDGLSSMLHAGDPLSARFEWDFGDPAGAHNALVGWTAAHVYDQPGVYTLSLTLRDELGRQSVGSIEVTVTPDTRTPIYVDSQGNDSNDGLSPQNAVQSAARVQELLGSGRAVWFRRDQVHDFGVDQLEISGLSDVVIGAFDTGARPILLGPPFEPSPGDPNFGIARTLIGIENRPGEPVINQIVVQDLAFRTPNPASPSTDNNHVALQVNGRDARNIVFRRNLCDDIGHCIILFKGSWAHADGYVYPHGFAAIDNEGVEMSSFFAFMAGYHLSLIGNIVTGGTHTGWIFRYYADRVLVANNDFQQPVSNFEEFAAAGGVHCDPAHGQLLGDCDGPPGNSEWGEYSYIVGNQLDGTLRLGYEAFRDGQTVYQSQRNVVVEGNVFSRAAPNQAPTPTLRHFPFTRNLRIRNNLFLGPGGESSFTAEHTSDIEFAHNTGLSPINGNMLSGFFGPVAQPGTFRFRNNLWALPAFHPDEFQGFPFVLSSPHADLSGFQFSGNVWPARVSGTSGEMYFGAQIDAGQWTGLPQVTDDRFEVLPLSHFDSSYLPAPGSPARGQGAAVAGVQVDFYGRPRPLSGAQIAGAVVDSPDAVFADGFEAD